MLIAGLPAIVSQWRDTRVVAYVPESAPLGLVSVVVTGPGGTSSVAALSVLPRVPHGRVL